jgi:hypothetical protein
MRARSKAVLGLVAIAGLGLAMMSPLAAEEAKTDKTGKNVQQTPKDAKPSAKCQAIDTLGMADQMIQYGRQQKCAECLLMAAQIMHRTGGEPLKAGRTVTGGQATQGGETGTKTAKQGNSPKSLVAEAKKMSSSPQVDQLAMATEKMLQETVRGSVTGPRFDNFSIGPFQTVNWNPVTFAANERAEVYISTGVFSRMILEVIDENGNVVARDTVAGNYYRCVWYPRWAGPFRFRLTSNDNLYFNGSLRTN